MMGTKKQWTPGEDEKLIKAYKNGEVLSLAKELKRPHNTLQNRMKYLRAKGKMERVRTAKLWSEEDERILIACYKTKTTTELANLLNRTESAISNKVKKLREQSFLHAPKKLGARRRKNEYTPEEKQMIIDLYKDFDVKEISKRLGRTVSSIYSVIALMQKQGKMPRKVIKKEYKEREHNYKEYFTVEQVMKRTGLKATQVLTKYEYIEHEKDGIYLIPKEVV